RILWVIRGLTNGCRIGGPQPAGDAHFIEICVCHERKQAAVLILPAEAAHTSLARSFKYRNFDDLARDRAAALRGLARSDRRESGIVNRLDETIPECVEHGTQRVNALGPRYMFLRLRTNGAVIDQRPAADAGRAAIDHDSRIDESPARIDMADTHFRD